MFWFSGNMLRRVTERPMLWQADEEKYLAIQA
jgi:hypothetical protein